MLMLITNSAAKLVAMAMASIMLASSSSTFAAPVLNLHGPGADKPLPSINCVKIQSNDINRASLVQGDHVPFKIDVSGCDPALIDASQPWTITLVNCQNHADTFTLADLVGGAEQKEFSWAVQTQQLKGLLDVNTNHIASTPDSNDSNKYHIQVDATSKDGTALLSGRTASFVIDTNSALHKRDDDNVAQVVTPITEVTPIPATDDSATPATDGNATPAIDTTPIHVGDIIPSPGSDIVTVSNEATDVNNVQDNSPAATVTPATPDVPAIEVQGALPAAEASPVVPDILNSLASPATNPAVPATASPSPLAVIPSPTYPNLPLEIIDNSQIVNTTGPNQPAKGDPTASKIIIETKKRTAGDVFLTYAGAGSAILSTVGLGLGGLVGGVVGGAVGLVIGLTAALVNSLYYAPNVA
ncbi:hypothetical protein BGZ95_003957 [Linnemannia exigua]|uniref:Uncharacterized protein n=1 Tax=Linnemannia exigua TaxID=604196 RepID=A0AAD4DI01_9FUNG|nr:hypothetical protein BGZ95_003957 [Linnemannia exigua]